jgi:chromosomal replication initiation ATPase DnaA
MHITTRLESSGERRNKLKRQGFDLHRIAERVVEILKIESGEVLSKRRQARKVMARELCCFWAARELGISHTELDGKLEMTLWHWVYS